MFQMNPSKLAKTYGERSKPEIGDKVRSTVDGVKRLGIIYQERSHKRKACEDRGKRN